MIWLTWRQFRSQALVIYGAVLVLIALLALTGPALAHLSGTAGTRFLSEVDGIDSDLYIVASLALLALPALIGMFWGAPLITRELDAGTQRLIWTQTTRTRWLVTKVAIIGLAAVAAAGLLSFAVSWWASPIDTAIADRTSVPGPGYFIFPRLSPEMFGARGIAPLGYAAFAFLLGVTFGVIVRRTLPAMALFLASYGITQVFMSVVVRPDLISPSRLTTPVSAANFLNLNFRGNLTVTVASRGAWGTGEQTINAAGHAVPVPAWMSSCIMRSSGGMTACFTRFTRLGYRELVTFQPASHFWMLQGAETAIYLALAVALAGVCTWWIRHRALRQDRAGIRDAEPFRAVPADVLRGIVNLVGHVEHQGEQRHPDGDPVVGLPENG
jgi:hypothetical protein